VKIRYLVWLRRLSQVFFFSLFLFFLTGTKLPQGVYIDYTASFSEGSDIRVSGPVDFFWRLDPLIWVTSSAASRHWIEGFAWAAAMLAAAFLLGRVFCGFICPFGALHHFISAVRPSLKGNDLLAANRARSNRKIKYFLLIAVLTAAAAGINFSGWLDPVSLLFRSMGLAVFPSIGNGFIHLVTLLIQSDVKVLNYLGYGMDYLTTRIFGYSYIAYHTGWFIGSIFLFILFLNRVRPRFFCRVICPLGALMGFCAKYGMLRLEQKNDVCTHCGICTKHCPGAASCEPGVDWQGSECLMCFNCQSLCPEKAVKFKFTLPFPSSSTINLERRHVLGGLLTGVSLAFFSKLDGKTYKTAPPELIRPPGALAESQFLERCARCGLCMKVCPTNAIHPAFAEAGIQGVWTPNLIMTMGYCEYSCTLCGSVCPTGAIAPLTAKEKIQTPVRIGSAYVDRGLCLPWSGNQPCIVCEEHCPTSPKAIYLRPDTIMKPGGEQVQVQLPFVELSRCVGCGICENKCPVKGRPAIRVISAGESRSAENQILL
jgi:MauM/NapG family ferredoxin protein